MLLQAGAVEEEQLVPLAVQLPQDRGDAAPYDIDVFYQPNRSVRTWTEIAAGGLVLLVCLQPDGAKIRKRFRLAALQGNADQGQVPVSAGAIFEDRSQEAEPITGDAGALWLVQGAGKWDRLGDVDDAAGALRLFFTAACGQKQTDQKREKQSVPFHDSSLLTSWFEFNL